MKPLVRRANRIRYEGRWVSSRWFIRYGKPVPDQPKPKPRPIPPEVQQKISLFVDLEAMVARGELTKDGYGRYGLP